MHLQDEPWDKTHTLISAELGLPRQFCWSKGARDSCCLCLWAACSRATGSRAQAVIHPKFVNQECLWKVTVRKGEEGALGEGSLNFTHFKEKGSQVSTVGEFKATETSMV